VLLHRLGIQAMRRGQLGRARELVTAAHRIHEHNNDRWGLTQTIGTFGAIARDAGDGTGAYALIQQSAELAGQIGVPWWQGGMLAELALLALSAGRVAEAGSHARAALAIADELADRPGRLFGMAPAPQAGDRCLVTARPDGLSTSARVAAEAERPVMAQAAGRPNSDLMRT
jgi:hypothetical protein